LLQTFWRSTKLAGSAQIPAALFLKVRPTIDLRLPMRSFLYSTKMLYLLITLLLVVFFLPELLGPLPALIIGGSAIAFALFIYNHWCKADSGKAPRVPPDNDL
jgi:hypothetical protein